jgi:hypothetical protein
MTGLEIYRGIIDIIRAIAWPAVAGFGIYYLRNEIKAAFKRVTEIGPGGAKFAPPEQQPTPPPSGVANTPSQQNAIRGTSVQNFIHSLKGMYSAELLEQFAQRVKSDLMTVAGNDAHEQAETLTYALAGVNIQVGYERTYASIFGSQLTFLAQANGEGGLVPAYAHQLYEQTKAANPALYAAYPFDRWVGFLIESALVITDARGNYALTPYGRGFLKYIVDRHLTVFKPN